MFYSQPKKILVTGGSGFLGSHLCKKLLEYHNYVICLDNLYTGSKDNISSLLKEPNFEFIRHDITFPIYLEVDEIYNLACPASPEKYQKDPVQTIKTCVHGSINMLGLAKRTNAKILQASTSEIYGDPEAHPQKEDYWGKVNPIGIRSCYDESKRCAETLFLDYNRQYNVDIKVSRIFNTYGPNMQNDDGRVISNFIYQALLEQPITIYGSGEQTRSFCYVSDMIDAFIKLMHTGKNFTGPVNLGNPEEFTILELAKKILSLTESNSKIIFKKIPEDDPRRRCPNIDLAKKMLKWKPKVNLNNGLVKTIEFFQNKYLGHLEK